MCKNLFKKGRVHRKTYIESTFEDIKELDPRKEYKYLGIEESQTQNIKMRKKS
jgi:hypothetical protein